MKRLGYVPALDGVRGLAIAAVCGLHFFGLSGGAYGVDVFFVLSGFLITTLLLEEHDSEGRIRLRSFYARRARRLLPAMGAMLVMVSLLAVGTYTAGKLAAILAAGGLYAANVIRASSSLLVGTPLDHTWSLAMEEQFYLIWPAVLIVLLRRRSQRVVAALGALFVALVAYRAVLAGFGVSEQRLYFAPDTHADGLVIGCFAAFVRRRGITMGRSAGWAAFVALVTLFAVGHHTAVWDAAALPAVEVAAAILVLAAVRRGALTALLSVRPLAWLGTVSYSVYIWHQPARWLTGPHPWQAIALTAILTLGSYYGIERPFRQRRAKLTAPASLGEIDEGPLAVSA